MKRYSLSLTKLHRNKINRYWAYALRNIRSVDQIQCTVFILTVECKYVRVLSSILVVVYTHSTRLLKRQTHTMDLALTWSSHSVLHHVHYDMRMLWQTTESLFVFLGKYGLRTIAGPTLRKFRIISEDTKVTKTKRELASSGHGKWDTECYLLLT